MIPPAPAIGGDSHEVAEWLRACASDDARTGIWGRWVYVELLEAFEAANPETLRVGPIPVVVDPMMPDDAFMVVGLPLIRCGAMRHLALDGLGCDREWGHEGPHTCQVFEPEQEERRGFEVHVVGGAEETQVWARARVVRDAERREDEGGPGTCDEIAAAAPGRGGASDRSWGALRARVREARGRVRAWRA